MIETQPFGRTGHESTRTLFGAAALGGMKPARVEQTLALIERYGVNHIDTAESYGRSEENLRPWLASNRAKVFLATKTRERGGPEARASLEQSLERMGVDSVDLIQLHNLVDEEGWQRAMAPGGVVEALAQARDEGLVRFLGVTGHGTFAAAMHLRSLDEFEFASVLAPYSYVMMQDAVYAADFEALASRCREKGVALQTIKSVARRRWQDESAPRFSWYEPLRDPDTIARQVRWVLSRPGVFLNTSSDATILETILEAASSPAEVSEAALAEDLRAHGVETLFVRGVSDVI